jgi:hypothetical protein
MGRGTGTSTAAKKNKKEEDALQEKGFKVGDEVFASIGSGVFLATPRCPPDQMPGSSTCLPPSMQLICPGRYAEAYALTSYYTAVVTNGLALCRHTRRKGVQDCED